MTPGPSHFRRPRPGAALLALAALAFASLPGCHRDPVRPSVLLVTIDTLRPDRLACYGYARSKTPNIDRVASSGARFAVAYCDIPWTTGSLASTMTGTFGPKHGVRSFTTRLAQDRVTLAEMLKPHGYTTGAIVASFAVDSAFQLDQGFDTYDDRLDRAVFSDGREGIGSVPLTGSATEVRREDMDLKLHNDAYRSDAEVTAAAERWIDQHRDEPFFLWVHYFGPHERIETRPAPNRAQAVVDEYDPDTRATDAAFGDLLDHLDALPSLASRTLLVLHSDHGQALREHGIFGHGHDLYEESVRIPMLMRLPGAIPAGTVVDTMARNVDIASTVLDYLGIAAPAGLDGRSLRPAILGQPQEEAGAYMEMLGGDSLPVPMPPAGVYFASSDWHGLRLGPWKYMNVRLKAPCIRNPASYRGGALGINPREPVGGQPLDGPACTAPLRQDLYAADGASPLREDLKANRVASQRSTAADYARRVASIADDSRDPSALDLDPAQQGKLKSLGYLQ